MRQYRLIIDKPTTGQRNMAVDEAIMNAVIAGDVLPTLRFYAWEPGCLSLGYGQTVRDADRDRITKQGWHLVRRATGGRAILHINELTYSIAFSDHHPMAAGGIIESYRRISGALMRGLERLHLRTAADRKEGRVRYTGPVCFEVPSHYEITTSDGRKLVGSAQLRRKGGVLQHGTLPIHGDVTRICDALAFDTPQKRDAAKMTVRRRAATLQDAIGEIIPWHTVVHALIAGFEEHFEMMFIQDALTPAEESDVERIEAEKYGNDAWTLRR